MFHTIFKPNLKQKKKKKKKKKKLIMIEIIKL